MTNEQIQGEIHRKAYELAYNLNQHVKEKGRLGCTQCETALLALNNALEDADSKSTKE